MSSFGIPSGNRRIGPARFNKTLRRQVLKRKQKIGRITAGAPPRVPPLPDVIISFLQKNNVGNTPINRAIAAGILGEGTVSERTKNFVVDRFNSAVNKTSAEFKFWQKFMAKIF